MHASVHIYVYVYAYVYVYIYVYVYTYVCVCVSRVPAARASVQRSARPLLRGPHRNFRRSIFAARFFSC